MIRSNNSPGEAVTARELAQLGQTYNLARRYLAGVGVVKDEAFGIEILEQLAAQGYAAAQFDLGVFFSQGVAQDLRRTATLFQQAADQGHAHAQFNLGCCYEHGDGVVKDEQRAFALYQQAANQNYAPALYNVAIFFQEGKLVVKDGRRAIALYKEAAKQGHVRAQFNLGCCFRDGTCGAQDRTQAVKYWQQAADQGCAEAQYSLGDALFHGDGVQKDSRRAVQLWQLAVNQKNACAQFNLSRLLFFGCDGVPQNTELAYKLCKLAVGQSVRVLDEEARAFLVVIKASLAPRACAACSTVEPVVRTYPKCNACRVVYYCGAECQRAHWQAHKLVCKALLEKAEAEKRGVFASMAQGR